MTLSVPAPRRVGASGDAVVRPQLAGTTTGSDDLSWMPAWKIRQKIDDREISPVEVTEHFLRRIETLDPALHAFRTIDWDGARRCARRAEGDLMSGQSLGLLHGIPVAVKDYVAVEGTAWQDALTGQLAVAPRDSIEVQRLRAAGAIVIGTTIGGLTTREFGTSDRQPQNPWDRTRVCGDSSSGSACALAAGMVPLAIAADGLGSTRLPASFCGLVGLHVTRGRIATADWSQMNSRLLSGTGPLTRDARDAAISLAVMAGPDGHDLVGLPDEPPDYIAGLDRGAAGMRLAWTDDFGFAARHAGPEASVVIEAVRRAAARLTTLGAEIVPMAEAIEDPSWACSVILASDRSTVIRSEPPRADVARARDLRNAVWSSYRQTLRDKDFILSPTIQFTAPSREEWAEGWRDASYASGYMARYSAHTASANLLGWPAISVPCGMLSGMPIGLQILGPPNSEPGMLQLANAFLATLNSSWATATQSQPPADPRRNCNVRSTTASGCSC